MARPAKRSRVQEDPKQEEQDDLAAMEASDSGSESEDNQEGMDYISADGAIEFGGDEPGSKKLKGRRAKREKEAKKKLKAGTFGKQFPEHELHCTTSSSLLLRIAPMDSPYRYLCIVLAYCLL